ncbi:MAG: dihydrolipoyl dehydrogenase [Candidatus Palauibacterales bacterium]|nr:dihydrolipoyl dehydrogenase [Candidatus Palauibacterales bacterium]MDP2585086.1 dihydrolipoyl dehydrogenase [Candidatus Palauibacterales bacterium]
MADSFDVVVIGAGPAGYVCAIRAAQLGLETACVESKSYEGGLGGTCLNWGCIPAKALLESAALAHKLQSQGAAFGVKPVQVEYDMGAAVERSRNISEKLTGGISYLFKKNEIESVIGHGRIAGKGKVHVEVEDGEDRELEAKHIVIATGSVMKTFPGFEFDREKVIGSREALALGELPSKMVVVGGGYVGVEFADVFDAFGVQVTLVEALDTLLPGFDQELGKTLARSYKKRGIDVRTGTRVKSLDRDADPMVLTVETKKGEETIETDLVLMAVGRRPVLEDVGLEEAGVETTDDGFIRVDKMLRTSVEGIYAIGDVAGQPMLAHKGSHEGIVAAEHIAGQNPHPLRHDNIPSIGYCHPEVASIGLSEEQAAEKGFDVKVGKFPLSAHGRALTAGDNEGFVKMVIDTKYGEVLGVHMIGHNVSELAAEAGIGRMLEATAEEFAAHPHGHPTMSEAVMEAALAAMDRAIHI